MSFAKKLKEIKTTLTTDYGELPIEKHQKPEKDKNQFRKKDTYSLKKMSISPVNGYFTNRDVVLVQQPVIVQKKMAKSISHTNLLQNKMLKSATLGSDMKIGLANKFATETKLNSNVNNTLKKNAHVDSFIPIDVPTRDRRKTPTLTETRQSNCPNKEIQIHIDDGSKDKDCLKKLFKKIHKLTQAFQESENQRQRLKLELDRLSDQKNECKNHEKLINKLEGDNYKYKMQTQLLKSTLNDYKQKYSGPKQIIIEKPVQVRIEVPKYIPGPEKIVQTIKEIQGPERIVEVIKEVQGPQRIVEVPKYIEKQVYREQRKELTSKIPSVEIVEKPVYIEKPIYIDKPVYIETNKIAPKQQKVEAVTVQVPFQVPVYIDRPVIDTEIMDKFDKMQTELTELTEQNTTLKKQNSNLLGNLKRMTCSIELLKQHNEEKNRQVQNMLNNDEGIRNIQKYRYSSSLSKYPKNRSTRY